MNNEPAPKSVLSPLVLRLAVGAIFLYHGLDKVFMQKDTDSGNSWANRLWESKQKPPRAVTDKLDAWVNAAEKDNVKSEREQAAKAARDALGQAFASGGDITPPKPLDTNYAQLAVAYGELVCGGLLLLGLLTRLAGLIMAVVQTGAIYMFTGLNWRNFSVLEGGYEFNVVLVAACLALLFMGGGVLSLDHMLWGKKPEQTPATAGV
jgi:uncharacterized membrane protein YphA (DoxX/SURF4 family)